MECGTHLSTAVGDWVPHSLSAVSYHASWGRRCTHFSICTQKNKSKPAPNKPSEKVPMVLWYLTLSLKLRLCLQSIGIILESQLIAKAPKTKIFAVLNKDTLDKVFTANTVIYHISHYFLSQLIDILINCHKALDQVLTAHRLEAMCCELHGVLLAQTSPVGVISFCLIWLSL